MQSIVSRPCFLLGGIRHAGPTRMRLPLRFCAKSIHQWTNRRNCEMAYFGLMNSDARQLERFVFRGRSRISGPSNWDEEPTSVQHPHFSSGSRANLPHLPINRSWLKTMATGSFGSFGSFCFAFASLVSADCEAPSSSKALLQSKARAKGWGLVFGICYCG